MNKGNSALKLVDEIILYYDAPSKKHHIPCVSYKKHKFLNIFGTAYLAQSEAKRVPYAFYCSFLGIVPRSFSTCIS